MVGVSLSKNVAAEGWIAQVAERLPVTDAGGRAPSPSVEARAFRRGHQRRPARSVIDSVYADGAICDPDLHRPLRSWGLRQNRPPPRRKRCRPMYGDATGRGQPVKPPFDPLEPTVDIAQKDFGGIRSKCPKVPQATRRAGKRVGHGERLLTIGRHLGHPSSNRPRRDLPCGGDSPRRYANAVWRRASASMAQAPPPRRPAPRR